MIRPLRCVGRSPKNVDVSLSYGRIGLIGEYSLDDLPRFNGSIQLGERGGKHSARKNELGVATNSFLQW